MGIRRAINMLKPPLYRRRGSWQAYLNIVYGIGSSLGAALGGAMADLLGWRWEFGVQVPLLVIGAFWGAAVVPSDLGLHGKPKESLGEALRAFDLRGSVLLTSAITALILGLVSLLASNTRRICGSDTGLTEPGG
jgi:MFS family permease